MPILELDSLDMHVKKYLRLKINIRLVSLFLAVILIGIGYREYKKIQERKKQIDLPQIHVQGELRALTLYSPTSYFIYRDKEMGYEYELCSMLANDLGLHLKMGGGTEPSGHVTDVGTWRGRHDRLQHAHHNRK